MYEYTVRVTLYDILQVTYSYNIQCNTDKYFPPPFTASKDKRRAREARKAAKTSKDDKDDDKDDDESDGEPQLSETNGNLCFLKG